MNRLIFVGFHVDDLKQLVKFLQEKEYDAEFIEWLKTLIRRNDEDL